MSKKSRLLTRLGLGAIVAVFVAASVGIGASGGFSVFGAGDRLLRAQERQARLGLDKLAPAPVTAAASDLNLVISDLQSPAYNATFRQLHEFQPQALAGDENAIKLVNDSRPKIAPILKNALKVTAVPNLDLQGLNSWSAQEHISYLVSVLCGEARQADRDGRLDDADRYLVGAARLAAALSVRNDPSGLQRRMAAQSQVSQAAAEIVSGESWRPQRAISVRAALDAMARPVSLRESITAQSSGTVKTLDHLAKTGEPKSAFGVQDPIHEAFYPTPVPRLARLIHLRPVRDNYVAAILDYWTDVFEALPEDPRDYANLLRISADLTKRLQAKTDPNAAYAKVLIQPLTESANAVVYEATQRQLLGACLSEMTGESTKPFIDPFAEAAGTPLRRTVLGRVVRFSSVGPNRQPDDPAGKSDDLTMEVLTNS